MYTLLPDALERLREKDQVQGQPELQSLSQKSYATSNTSVLNVTGAGQMAQWFINTWSSRTQIQSSASTLAGSALSHLILSWPPQAPTHMGHIFRNTHKQKH